jgi:hypothetical protein
MLSPLLWEDGPVAVAPCAKSLGSMEGPLKRLFLWQRLLLLILSMLYPTEGTMVRRARRQ